MPVPLTIAYFGEPVIVCAVGGEIIVRLNRTYVRLAGDVAVETTAPATSDDRTGPFTLTAFGTVRRLAWNGGGCSVRARARVAFWGDRYAAIVERGAIIVIDAARGRQARLALPAEVARLEGTGVGTDATMLAIGDDACVVQVPLDVLAEIVDGEGREVTVEVRTSYPLRRAEASAEARVVYVLTDADALVNIGTKQIRLDGSFGLEPKMTIVMRDELLPGTFAAVDVPGRPRQTIRELAPPRNLVARVFRGRPRDPAATGASIAPGERRPELDRLLAALARDPEDDANRIVLVDLLQELGTAYGAWVETGGAKPSPARRRELLGPLALFLDDVTYRGGLPWSASLVRRPPDAPELVQAAAEDLRLGLFSTLRAGKAPLPIYRQLVGSPRAIGLRRVDAPDRDTLRTLIDAGRDGLTHLHDVRFTKPAGAALLADPAFDRVGEVDTVLRENQAASLFNRLTTVARAFFARAPRHLVLRERYGLDHYLIPVTCERFAESPLAAVTAGPLTLLRRDGDVTAKLSMKLERWYREQCVAALARALPQLASIELPGDDPELHAAVRAALPNATIV